MRAPDPATVEIETTKPFPVMLNALLGMDIMDRKWSEENGAAAASDLTSQTENYATRHANGTGPFKLVSREADGPTVLAAFDGWWDKRRHNLDQVTFLPIRNAATRTAALLAGTTDATVDLPLQDVDRVARDPALQVVQGPELRTIYIGLDTFRDELLFSDVKGKNPLKDHRVREALYRAIDEDAIHHAIMRDQSWPAGFMASPHSDGRAAGFEYAAALRPGPPRNGFWPRRATPMGSAWGSPAPTTAMSMTSASARPSHRCGRRPASR